MDLTIHLDRSEPQPPGHLPWELSEPPWLVWRARTVDGTWLRLRYERGDEWAEFVVDPTGKTVWASWADDVLFEEASELLFGPVFSCILGQRGVTCLHAGVVAVDDRVVAVIGEKGAGKSTTCLALVQRGGSFVADDVAALTERDGRPAVAVGAPMLRMRPDSAETLCGSFEALEPMWANEEFRPRKRYVDLRASSLGSAEGAVALDALYLLAPRHSADRSPSIRPLPAVEALPRLMTNRHMVHLLEQSGHRRDFEVLAALATSVPAREVLRPEGLHAIDSTVDVLLADVGALA